MRRSKARTGHASNIGGRAEQQDRAACLASDDGEAYLLVVADGMGGRLGGEQAAQAVVDTAARLWGARRTAPADPAGFLETLCQQAHSEIRRHAQEGRESGGATVVALLATAQRAWWVHVGDSRAYGFRDGVLVFRTEDHTVVQNLVRAGRITESEAALHPEQHKLLRGLGGDDEVQTTHGRMQVNANSGFVLCTDGFWAQVGAEEMADLLSAESPEAACVRWAAIAAERGGADGDNATVAVLQPAGAPARLTHRQLWPLYAALAAAVVLGLSQLFR